MKRELLIAGFGGQGVLLLGRVLAEAAMQEGREVSWLPSYGPEQRGGTCHCSVVISDQSIGSPLVSEPDILVVMNRPSLERFKTSVKRGGVLFLNSSLVQETSGRADIDEIRVAASDIAEKLGNPRVANMVMLGAMLAREPLARMDSVRVALDRILPERHKHLIDINLQALEQGAVA